MEYLGNKQRASESKPIIVVALNGDCVARRQRIPRGDRGPAAKRVRIVKIVPVEFVRAAMELVGPSLSGHHNLTTAAASKRCIVVAPLQGELLDGVNARGVQQGTVRTAVIDVSAIDGIVVGPRACSVH